MTELQQYIHQFGILTPEEIKALDQLTEEKQLQKGDYFITQGTTCKKIAFIQNGFFRSFYYSRTAEEVTYCFLSGNNFLTAYSSFINQSPTTENIQALTDATLYYIDRKDILQLEASSTNWLKLFKVMAEQEYIHLEKRIFLLQRESAETRYQQLLENHPEYLRAVPLQYIASYLGVTPRHLSRIRKSIFT